jgi:ABC-type antimicrobial peptide transport system permease subunit
MPSDLSKKIPRLPEKILKKMTAYHLYHSAIDDFSESFEEILKADGMQKARRWYWIHMLKSIPEYIRFMILWRIIMFTNYLKTALRSIGKNKSYAFITVFGLAVGMMCALFILVFAEHELSYDRFHEEIDNVYQVLVHKDIKNNSVTPTLLAPHLKDNYPEVVEATRFHWFWGETILQYDQHIFYEHRIQLVDPGFFEIFSFPFIKGDPETALMDPNSIVMTQELAEKYFGSEDPLGKTIMMNHQHPLTVTGVIRNIPSNSSIGFNILIPIQFNIENQRDWYLGWNNLFVFTFIKCRENIQPEAFTKKIEGIISDQGGGDHASLSLLPYKERYFFLYSDKTTVIVFLSVAVFILLIAAFNFVNLSTALSFRRAKEVGMRKILGAQKKQIIFQYLGESVLLAFIAALLSFILFVLSHPLFKTITGGDIEISTSMILYSTLAIALMTGLIAGIYPAFFLSAFRIVHILKGKQGTGVKNGKLRKGIVIIQFSLSILLLLGMTGVYQQIHYMQNKDLGYHKENIVIIRMGGGSEEYFQVFKNELLNLSGIVNVTGMSLPLPFFGWQIDAFQWEGKDPNEKISISFNEMDYGFIETMNINLVDGRDMSPEFFTDEVHGIFVNERMAKLMDVDPVVGATIMQGDVPLHIVGVIEDFHFHSLRHEIEPLILLLYPPDIDNALIRIHPENKPETIDQIRKTWEKTVPGYPFQFTYLDEDFNQSLSSMRQTGYLLTTFAILAIVIACMGLFGLSSFMAEQSTKEIGIRKVHGASIINIIKKLSIRFILLVLIANGVVLPLAYYLMNQWLNNFAFRTKIQIPMFLMTTAVSIIIAFLSVSYQSIKAARANPVEALRYE